LTTNLAPEEDQPDRSELEAIESEEEDHEASLPVYDILTYPADYTLEVLVDKLGKDQIRIPRFQRRFVWTQVQASKLIESFLRGLPVPAIFLYSDPEDNTLLVVDGQQRLKTIGYFYEGYFGEEERGRRPVFRLTGLDEGSPFLGKTLGDLERENQPAFNKLNDAVLRAFIIKQLDPRDNTSIYHVFERLNTGGTLLHPQEIRNSIYQGALNDLLLELNDEADWRTLFGRRDPDKRQRDAELILRFLALTESLASYAKPMKEFLNTFMREHRNPSQEVLAKYADTFRRTVASVVAVLGERPFHIRAGLNAAVFDSVSVAFARNLDQVEVGSGELLDRYRALVSDENFLALVSSSTTDAEVVRLRLEKAEQVLFR